MTGSNHMQRPLRVAHVITGLNVGGAEVALERLVTTLPPDDFDCRVWSLGSVGEVGERLRQRGVMVDALDIRASPLSVIDAARKLRARLKAFAPSIVQGWMYHGNLAALACAPRGDVAPVVSWNIRGSLDSLPFEKPLTRAVIRLSRWFATRADAIVNNSDASARAHEQLGYPRDRWVMIPNGFDVDRFAPSVTMRAAFRQGYELAQSSLLVGAVGRFVPVKGHAVLLEALQRLAGVIPQIVGVFAGPGLEAGNAAFARLCRDLAPSVRIIALGNVAEPERLLPALDVLCLPSLSEGFPNVVAEAMSCAVCCVVTDVGDARWIVGDAGLVVPPGDAELLSEALGSALRWNAAEREHRGQLGRQRIVRKFSLGAMRDAYATLYQRLAMSEAGR